MRPQAASAHLIGVTAPELLNGFAERDLGLCWIAVTGQHADRDAELGGLSYPLSCLLTLT